MFVSRQRAGPTTRNPTTPDWARISRRLVKAAISFSPRLGTRFSKAPELAAGDAEDARLAPRHGGHDDGTAGENVDVAGKLARLVDVDHPLAVRRVLDLDLAGFHNHQIDIRLTGPKDGLAIGVVAGRRQRPDESDLGAVKRGKATS